MGQINNAVTNAHQVAVDHGFWGEGTQGTIGLVAKLGLVMCEVAEVIEAVRKPEEASSKCPELTCEEEEVADVFLRLADYCGARDIDLERAVQLKHTHNASREYMHGKKA